MPGSALLHTPRDSRDGPVTTEAGDTLLEHAVGSPSARHPASGGIGRPGPDPGARRASLRCRSMAGPSDPAWRPGRRQPAGWPLACRQPQARRPRRAPDRRRQRHAAFGRPLTSFPPLDQLAVQCSALWTPSPKRRGLRHEPQGCGTFRSPNPPCRSLCWTSSPIT